MTISVSPSKFDICLISGVIFNFACVTANYWPPPPPMTSMQLPPVGGSSPPLNNVYSDPVRIVPGSASSSPYYPPNYASSSSRMDPYGVMRSDPYNRYPSSPPQYGYGYSNSLSPMPPASHYPYGFSGNSYRPYSSPSRYPVPYQSSQNQIPYQYWRTPPNYDAFSDRRQGMYGGTSSPSTLFPIPVSYGGMHSGMPYSPYDVYAPRVAYARMKSKEKVEGEVRFVQQDNRYVSITGRITGLIPGAHGLHVHEGSDKDGTCENIGQHFNPHKQDHGGKSEWTRHVSDLTTMLWTVDPHLINPQVGDLGNIFADNEGIAFFSITDTLMSLTGPHSVLNRTLVVTEFGDDLGRGADQSKINGNSGKPIACGIITLTPYS